VAPASIYLAVMTTLYNILAVITLTRHQSAAHMDATTVRTRMVPLLGSIGKNPLIISIAAGVAISLAVLGFREWFWIRGNIWPR
jgi:hypothetical protein